MKKSKGFLVILLALLMFISACKPITNDIIRPNGSNSGEEDDGEEENSDLPEQGLFESGNTQNNENNPENPENAVDKGFEALFGAPQNSNTSAISSTYGACYNLTDDIFLYGKGVDERVYPSGAAKLLTALTVYDALNADNPNFSFIVGDEIDMVQAGSGVAGLEEEQSLGMEAMLTALLIPVGNDAAYTVSVNTARFLSESADSRNFSNNEMNDYFIRMMNNYAKKIGCTNSNFTNPDGYHGSNNYSTVRDLALISSAAAKNAMIAAICGKKEHQVTFNSGEVASWSSSNSFLSLEGWDIRGLRTGYTDESGFSAQILVFINSKEYIIVVSGAGSSAQRERDVLRLLEIARDGHVEDVISVFDS
ncbi:MAG: hypothetical protein FWG44_01965 [Oscillospiraceae bacterium]|nr:hypothetical protein [Oscillospiraceae bacterium]